MADLAEAAQVSVGTIYRSFASKSDIIQAIIEADTNATLCTLQEDIEKVAKGAAAGLEGMILRWLSQREDDALTHEIVAECHRNSQLAELIACVCANYRDQFRILARLLQPDASQVQVEGASDLFLACLFGMGSRGFTAPVLDDRQTAQIITSLILKALDVPA